EVVNFAIPTRLVVQMLPASPKSPSVTRAAVGARGPVAPVMLTWSNVAVASTPLLLCAVNARPTNTVRPMLIVWGPAICVQVFPSGDQKAVKTLPWRLSRSQSGGGRGLLMSG